MDLEKIDKNNTSIIKYSKTDNVLKDIWSYVNILDTKSQTFLCYTSS